MNGFIGISVKSLLVNGEWVTSQFYSMWMQFLLAIWEDDGTMALWVIHWFAEMIGGFLLVIAAIKCLG